VLSFGFFALHTTTRPYKIPADNAFRAARRSTSSS